MIRAEVAKRKNEAAVLLGRSDGLAKVKAPKGTAKMSERKRKSPSENDTPLTIMQLWVLLAGGPIAMVLTVMVGILVNNAITKGNIAALRSDILRVEGVLGSKIDVLAARVKSLEDEIHSPLVKR